jgi:hypothetical protein
MGEGKNASGLVGKLEKIAEGRYREVYKEGKWAVKVVKPYIRKVWGWVNFPTRLYAKFAFGNTDLNALEYRNYNNCIGLLPLHIRDRFLPIMGVSETPSGSLCRCELVTDADGSISKTLADHGNVRDKHFWYIIGEIESALLKQEIPYFNISDKNLLVRRDGVDCYPMFVDHKRVGKMSTILQPNAWTDIGAERKIRREFKRLYERYAIL